MGRTFQASWIQATDLIAATLLNQRGLKSTVEWEGQLSGKATLRTSGIPTVNEYVGDYATTNILDLRQPMSTSRSATTASTNSVSLLAESQDANSWASSCAQARYSGFARIWSTASRTCSGVGVSVAR
jgi:hypothetical protein